MFFAKTPALSPAITANSELVRETEAQRRSLYEALRQEGVLAPPVNLTVDEFKEADPHCIFFGFLEGLKNGNYDLSTFAQYYAYAYLAISEPDSLPNIQEVQERATHAYQDKTVFSQT